MVVAAIVGEYEFWVLILEEGKGEFWVQGKEKLMCEKRREVSGFVRFCNVYLVGKIRFIFKSNFKKINIKK